MRINFGVYFRGSWKHTGVLTCHIVIIYIDTVCKLPHLHYLLSQILAIEFEFVLYTPGKPSTANQVLARRYASACAYTRVLEREDRRALA